MIQLAISANSFELLQKLEGFPQHLQNILVAKMHAAISAVYQNVHGKLPDFQYTYGVDRIGDLVIGYIEPSSPKEIAREFGGKGFYPIYGKPWLAFYWDRVGKKIAFREVFHPPSKEYADIRAAIAEYMPTFEASVEAEIEREF